MAKRTETNVFLLILVLEAFSESIVVSQSHWHRRIKFESSAWGGQLIAKKTATFPECVKMCYRENCTAFGYQPISNDCKAFYELTYGTTANQFNTDTMVFINNMEYVIRSQEDQLLLWINEIDEFQQSWDSAQATCAAKNGRLLVLDSALKEQQFNDIIRTVDKFKTLWLGLRYSESQGKYLWSSGSTFQWGSGKYYFDFIDNQLGTTAHCGYIRVDQFSSHVYDQDCSRAKAFICELL